MVMMMMRMMMIVMMMLCSSSSSSSSFAPLLREHVPPLGVDPFAKALCGDGKRRGRDLWVRVGRREKGGGSKGKRNTKISNKKNKKQKTNIIKHEL